MFVFLIFSNFATIFNAVVSHSSKLLLWLSFEVICKSTKYLQSRNCMALICYYSQHMDCECSLTDGIFGDIARPFPGLKTSSDFSFRSSLFALSDSS